MKSLYPSIFLAGLLACCSGGRAENSVPQRPLNLPVEREVEVKEVRGSVEYSCDGSGWRPLAAGKLLQPGATIRAAIASRAILRVDSRPALLRITPETSLKIIAKAPAEERTTAALAVPGGK